MKEKRNLHTIVNLSSNPNDYIQFNHICICYLNYSNSLNQDKLSSKVKWTILNIGDYYFLINKLNK